MRRLSAPQNEIETVSISDLERERKRAPETSVLVSHINHLDQQIEFSGNLEQPISILKIQIACICDNFQILYHGDHQVYGSPVNALQQSLVPFTLTIGELEDIQN
ncbi:hypothetical protein EIN_005290 [Entamoeba invadens IP1]|uniref:Uncharacterized protein n=1 Tax=Entamoeba invadens IP1 TaxID=370355 RepID=A0A0A1UCL5_ENTIV|nr:hypothetical protein EIN_005290 [Entamoeba invadens IP1]ELP93658.1 hypothetical protein EIN_005290 [Entamoeba invadens IP1]|eukprot:XP_004260429.1 hypothetical protein EIN_005290 [Entamoeba invadens IP1]